MIASAPSIHRPLQGQRSHFPTNCGLVDVVASLELLLPAIGRFEVVLPTGGSECPRFLLQHWPTDRNVMAPSLLKPLPRHVIDIVDRSQPLSIGWRILFKSCHELCFSLENCCHLHLPNAERLRKLSTGFTVPRSNQLNFVFQRQLFSRGRLLRCHYHNSQQRVSATKLSSQNASRTSKTTLSKTIISLSLGQGCSIRRSRSTRRSPRDYW